MTSCALSGSRRSGSRELNRALDGGPDLVMDDGGDLVNTLHAERPGLEGMKHVMSPPLRAKHNQHALWNALALGSIDTVGTGTRREAIVNVRYKFVSSVDTCTDTRACFNCTFERVHRPQMRKAA